MAWVANIPAASDTLAKSQPDLNNNFDAINTALNVEHVGHVAASTAGVAGRHKFALGGTGARPATSVAGGFFIRTDVTPAHGEYYDGSAWQTIGINSGTQTFGGAKTFSAAITFTDTVTLGTDPTLALEAATKQYVDGVVDTYCQLGSVSDVNITTAPTNIDGAAGVTNSLILLKDQSTAVENGVWTYNGAGSAMTRAANWGTSDTPLSGSIARVLNGTVNAESFWSLTTAGTITPGSTTMTFIPMAVADAGTLPSAAQGASARGEVKFPNGVYVQWGREGTGSNGGVAAQGTITFDTAFLTGNVPAVFMQVDESITASGPVVVRLDTTTTTNTAFVYTAFELDGSFTVGIDYLNWVAVGRWR